MCDVILVFCSRLQLAHVENQGKAEQFYGLTTYTLYLYFYAFNIFQSFPNSNSSRQLRVTFCLNFLLFLIKPCLRLSSRYSTKWHLTVCIVMKRILCWDTSQPCFAYSPSVLSFYVLLFAAIFIYIKRCTMSCVLL